MMTEMYDVVIVGGAVIGSAVAYCRTANPDFTGSVLVVEKDPTYVKASTSLSSSSIRTQFSNPINVKISQYGSEVIRNFGEMMRFRNKARAQGAEFLKDEVTGIGRGGNTITGVTLASGHVVKAGTVVNCSGPRMAQTAGMARLDIPVEPRKCTLFVFDCAKTPEGAATVNQGRLPLMIDPSGVFCRPEGKDFLAGCATDPDPGVGWNDFDPRYGEFEGIVWPALAERSDSFVAIKAINEWAGHYAFNTLVHNRVVGRHPEVENFIFVNGVSGHGLQQGPATGRGVSELIIYGRFRSLDLSLLGYERIAENRPFLEKAVI